MLKLDHITVVAPNLSEGVAHVRECLDLDVPFGTRHEYMGTHNHRVWLGDFVYLEIVALDPDGRPPSRARWFQLDDQRTVRSDWDAGRRLRGWVASTDDIDTVVATHTDVFGSVVPLPGADPTFGFSIPPDGSLPLDGAAPSLIDRRADPIALERMPDLGARLLSLTLEHPNPAQIETLYRAISVDRPPTVIAGPAVRYRACVMTPSGEKSLS